MATRHLAQKPATHPGNPYPANPMPATYTASDFDKPKVVGLAIHNAQKAVNAAHVRWEERSDGFRVLPEICAYCLFAVLPDCSVRTISAGEPTATEHNALLRKPNLVLLAKSHGAIGFVSKRTPGAKTVYEPVSHVTKGGRK